VGVVGRCRRGPGEVQVDCVLREHGDESDGRQRKSLRDVLLCCLRGPCEKEGGGYDGSAENEYPFDVSLDDYVPANSSRARITMAGAERASRATTRSQLLAAALFTGYPAESGVTVCVW
jgi:hypothetical protein